MQFYYVYADDKIQNDFVFCFQIYFGCIKNPCEFVQKQYKKHKHVFYNHV